MPINNLAFAEKFTGELDKVLVQGASVGFMTDNAFRAKFVGAKTVKIPDIELQGLGDYDRDTGFIRGTVSISNTAYTMQQDRARSFQIDREDLDETGVQELAGAVMSEFVRTKVIPETDAYVLSKLAGLAVTQNQKAADYNDNPYEVFLELQQKVQEAAGYDEELVCFVDSLVWSALKADSNISRFIDAGNFKQGAIDLTVKKLDGVTLIPVPTSRMKTAYTFYDGTTEGQEDGGFEPDEAAENIKMLMLPKKAAMLVRKSEKIRTFTPDQNLTADAYKFDYRMYYDVFVKTSYAPTVWASILTPVEVPDEVPDEE